MNAPDVGEASVELAWLAPCAASLVTLARAPTVSAWQSLRHDPGAVLLLLRQSSGDLATSAFFQNADILPAAFDLLSRPGFIDWRNPALHSLFVTIQRQAQLAHGLARRLKMCDPERAWIGGLLAPLGWLAACAVAPEVVADSLTQSVPQSVEASLHLGRLDHTAIARRFVRRWKLPAWLGAIVGHLGLSAAIAEAIGADPRVFEIVQLAVALLQERGRGLPLAVGSSADELGESLRMSREDVERVWAETHDVEIVPPQNWEAPAQCPLLPDLLQMAIANRRNGDPTLVERLQRDLDALQQALERQCAGEKDRLQAKKLAALAELAAGAGHEINNPLAVISGQAQYVLKKVVSGQWSVVSKKPVSGGVVSAGVVSGEELAAPSSADSSPLTPHHAPEADNSALTAALQTIVNQAQRIHQILVDLMQFAKPPAPQPQHVELNGLIRGVIEMLEPLAQERAVQLVCAEPPGSYALYVDPGQVRQALTCLLRNAIEAAPADGWAGLRVQPLDAEGLDIHVEDNGPGPSPAAVEHLFDPFYSGRMAGRGRGLGLTTAWRLARQNHGSVHFAGHSGGVTRFVLHLSQARLHAPEPGANGQHAPGNGSAIIVSSSC